MLDPAHTTVSMGSAVNSRVAAPDTYISHHHFDVDVERMAESLHLPSWSLLIKLAKFLACCIAIRYGRTVTVILHNMSYANRFPLNCQLHVLVAIRRESATLLVVSFLYKTAVCCNRWTQKLNVWRERNEYNRAHC
jgi:hypothetical protein